MPMGVRHTPVEGALPERDLLLRTGVWPFGGGVHTARHRASPSLMRSKAPCITGGRKELPCRLAYRLGSPNPLRRGGGGWPTPRGPPPSPFPIHIRKNIHQETNVLY